MLRSHCNNKKTAECYRGRLDNYGFEEANYLMKRLIHHVKVVIIETTHPYSLATILHYFHPKRLIMKGSGFPAYWTQQTSQLDLPPAYRLHTHTFLEAKN